MIIGSDGIPLEWPWNKAPFEEWPRFCPKDGRPLDLESWVTVDGRRRYWYLRCLGSNWWDRFWARLSIGPQKGHWQWNAGDDPLPSKHDVYTGDRR